MYLKNILIAGLFIVMGIGLSSCEKDYVPTEVKTTDILTDVNPQTGEIGRAHV